MPYAPKSKTFSEIWKLIDRNYEEGDFGSRELLIGIFWEETMFQNRKQLLGPAVGFGQVEPQIIKAVNSFARKNYNETLILISDDASVRVSIDVLNMLWSRLSTPRAVLDGYAGTAHRPVNGTKVSQWLTCENILKSRLFGIVGSGIDTFDSETVTRALTAAEPNHKTKAASVVDV